MRVFFDGRRRVRGFLVVGLTPFLAACGDSMADEAGEVEAVVEEASDETRMAVIPAESSILLRTDSKLSTKDSSEGDTFTLTVTRDVRGESGRVVLPAGTKARGRVTAAAKSPGSDQPAVLRLAVESIVVDGRPVGVSGEIVEAEVQGDRKDAGGETAVKIVGGAAAGALLGRILGDDGEDAIKGAVAGAAAGTAIALKTKDGHAELPAGSRLTYRVAEPLIVR